MGDRFDQRNVRIENIAKDIFCVAGGTDAEHFHFCALRLHLLAQLVEHLDRVLNRIAIRQLIGLAENLAVLAQQDSFGRSGTAVDSNKSRHYLSRRKSRRDELLPAVSRPKLLQFIAAGDQTLAAGDSFLLGAAVLDVPAQFFGAEIPAHFPLFVLAKLNRSKGCEVLRIFGNLDQIFRRRAFRDLHFALFPHARDVSLPGFAHAADEAVRAAQQQHVGAQSVAARQHAQILQDDGLEEGGHQFVRGRAGFLQAIDVGLSKNAALAGNLMQLDAVISLVGKLGCGNLELRVDLVDDRARSARALVVHRRNLLFSSRLLIVFEDDDLRILASQLDDGIHLGVQLLDRQRHSVHFLHEFGADHLGQRAAAGAGDEDPRRLRRHARFRFHPLQELKHLFRLACLVALIILPEDGIVCGVNNDGLHRR